MSRAALSLACSALLTRAQQLFEIDAELDLYPGSECGGIVHEAFERETLAEIRKLGWSAADLESAIVEATSERFLHFSAMSSVLSPAILAEEGGAS